MPTQIELVPIITSVAGSCLTLPNWEATGVRFLSIQLEQLLIKPGLDFFNSSSLKSYFPWKGQFFLNGASLSILNGTITLRSPFDGRVLKLPEAQVNAAISAWDMKGIFFPNLTSEDEDARVFYKTCIEEDGYRGVENAKGEILLYGEIDLKIRDKLPPAIPIYFESDKPARDACSGYIYSDDHQLFYLLDATFAHDFQLLQKDCPCPTCAQGYTRAYLHHLLQNTPLLAQRFLIQHNIFFWRTYLRG